MFQVTIVGQFVFFEEIATSVVYFKNGSGIPFIDIIIVNYNILISNILKNKFKKAMIFQWQIYRIQIQKLEVMFAASYTCRDEKTAYFS